MKHVVILTKKELFSFFNSAIAYIFFTLFLILLSFLFFRVYFLQGVVSMQGFFNLIPWVFLMFIPAVSMKSWSEEKKNNTLQILLTMPASDAELVLGKFFGSFIFVSIAILLSLIVPIMVSFTGNLDWGPVFTSYLGTLFLAGACLSVGNFVSSLTENQITAFLLSAVIIFIFLMTGSEVVYSIFPDSIAEVLRNFSLRFHFNSIARGVVDSRDIIYYISFIFLFLYYNTTSIQSRSW